MCGDRDIFADDPLTGSQLLAFANTPTLVDPVVPARSAETEKAMQPVLNLNWVVEVEEQNSTHLEHCSLEQEVGQEDPCFSSSPVEPLSQGGSREEAEQWSHQSEPSDNVQELVLEAKHMASYQATLDCISGHGSKPKGVSKCKLGYVRECMLRDWYQPELNIVWAECKVFGRLYGL